MAKKKPDPQEDFQQAASLPKATHALYFDADDDFATSLPEDYALVGSLKELQEFYDNLVEEYTDGVTNPKAIQKIVQALEEKTTLYELKNKPTLYVPKGGVMGTGLKGPSVDDLLDAVENLDVNKVGRKARDMGVEAIETWFGKTNPGTWLKWGLRGKDAVSKGKDIVKKADEARKDAISYVTGSNGGNADGFVKGTDRYVKFSWVAKPKNATMLETLDLIGSVGQEEPEEAPESRKKRGGKGPSPS